MRFNVNTFDLIMLAIIAILAIVGFVRGAVKTILSVVGGILSYVLSCVFGKRLAEPVYNSFIKESINDKISSRITETLESDSGNIGDSIIELLPDSVQLFIGDTELVDSLNSITGETTAQVIDSSTQIIHQVVEPVFIGLLSVCIAIVLFIILNLIITILLHMSDFINEIPVIGKANKIAGAIIGFMSGLVLTFAVVAVFTQFIPTISENSEFSNDIKETSLFFDIFAEEQFANEPSAEEEYEYSIE